MKKENRLIKINDNFSTVEIYLDTGESLSPQEFPVSVLVKSRTFSGSYNCRIDRKKMVDFAGESRQWLEKLSGCGNDAFSAGITFSARNDALTLELEGISHSKIRWNLIFRPFLPDIEILMLKIETEAHLVHALERAMEKLPR